MNAVLAAARAVVEASKAVQVSALFDRIEELERMLLQGALVAA